MLPSDACRMEARFLRPLCRLAACLTPPLPGHDTTVCLECCTGCFISHSLHFKYGFRTTHVCLQVIRRHRLEREADYAAQREKEWEQALEEEAQRHRLQPYCSVESVHCRLCRLAAQEVPRWPRPVHASVHWSISKPNPLSTTSVLNTGLHTLSGNTCRPTQSDA